MIICDSCKNKAYGAMTLNVMGVKRTVDICIPCLEAFCNNFGIDKKGFVPTAKEIMQDAAIRKDAENNVPNGSNAGNLESVTSCTTIELPSDFPTVKIGDQVWTAGNLDVDDGGKGIYHNEENDETYYTWEAAVRVCGKLKGWHLPTKEEWEKLVESCGGEHDAGRALKDANSWGGRGSDAFSFSALPAGGRYYNGSFYAVGYYAYFWSATEYGSDDAYIMHLRYFSDLAYLDYYDKNHGFSVRCVMD